MLHEMDHQAGFEEVAPWLRDLVFVKVPVMEAFLKKKDELMLKTAAHSNKVFTEKVRTENKAMHEKTMREIKKEIRRMSKIYKGLNMGVTTGGL